jgi:tRNA threonylcarbamoyladenosine biosynthesis protein TsaB
MPRLLAIECSTDACSVALALEGDVQERWVVRPREHHRILLPMVMDLCRDNHSSPEQMDAIAYGAGPGSFTGLRLCVGVVQGLAFALQKPVIPISNLAATALSFAQQHAIRHQTLLVALDARMGDVYLGVYHMAGDGMTALAEDRLLSRQVLEQSLEAYPEALRIGSGWPQSPECYPHAAAVLALAEPCFRRGQVQEATAAMPVYLRETVSWQKWQPKSARQPG